MTYEDEEEKSSKHPDAPANYEFYKKQMDRVLWLYPDRNDSPTTGFSNPVRIILSGDGFWKDGEKIIAEPSNVSFTYPKVNAKELLRIGMDDWCKVIESGRATSMISFHEPNRGFRIELCWVLNHLGGLGYLEHKTRLSNGSPRDKPEPAFDDPWKNLFG